MQYFKRHSEAKMPHCILDNDNNVIPTFIFIQKSKLLNEHMMKYGSIISLRSVVVKHNSTILLRSEIERT